MTPEELMEKVAREMREDWRDRMAVTDRAETLPWDDIEAEERADCIAMARAAVRVVRDALREPDGMMMAAGEEADADCEGLDSGKACLVLWRAMLAASPLGRIDDA
jgi:hypothetical protein